MLTRLLTRRSAIASIAATAVRPRALFAQNSEDLSTTLAALETRSKGRLGVAILFPSGKQVTHRADERFPMCSTFKFLAASLILQRVDQGKEHLDRAVAFSKSDLVTYSPETEKHAGGSMTVAELSKAALTLSDNTAANLLLASFGGPPALTAFARSIGDPLTRLDRNETTLNESTPGDPRDTTTPNAMLANLQRIFFGNVLKPASRQQLTDWMLANTTGKPKFVAGLPSTWKVADKTGSGEHGSNNDIGVLYPPDGEPIFITSYLTETAISTDERNAIHADIASAIAATHQP
ncbi:class A beta-lactamase [Edaphobacter modestus]|uniref:beta-lactamase n=1 Tax=Edaphobacter modestus TaxID=388466 RepID=A0A4Q7YWS7_9BACT|nr:class A beta-lactamase [Edaphobacter modestus]RZU41573.1 beta-lactamase class A [Edaphobacter modestus]